MRAPRLATLRFLALFFLLPGLAGLIVSAMVSTHYLDSLPRSPDPEQLRIVPLSIDGTVVYQTVAENRRFEWMEYSSVAVFIVGLGLGLVYLEKWGSVQSQAAEENNSLSENSI